MFKLLFFSRLKVTNVQHKNLLSQQIQLNFTFHVYKETKYRLFSKASSHLSLQLGWTMRPSGKDNCTAVARGHVCSCCSQSVIWWMEYYWSNTTSCVFGETCIGWPPASGWRGTVILGILNTKIHWCGWCHRCKGMNLFFFHLCVETEEISLTRSNMRDRIQCCGTGGPCSYSYLWMLAS